MTKDPIEDDVNSYRYVGNNPMLFVDPFGLEDAGTGDSGIFRRCTRDAIRRQFGVPDIVTRLMRHLGVGSVEIDGRFYAQLNRCEKCCEDGTWKPSVSGSIGASLYAKAVSGALDLRYVKLEYGLYFRGGGAGSLCYAYDGCEDQLSGGGCFSVFLEGGLIGQVEVKGRWVSGGAGVRGGLNVKSTLCLSCNVQACQVTGKTCVGFRARVWAFLQLHTWWSDKRWEYLREWSADVCTPTVPVYTFSAH